MQQSSCDDGVTRPRPLFGESYDISVRGIISTSSVLIITLRGLVAAQSKTLVENPY
jgi:hypothetical protein